MTAALGCLGYLLLAVPLALVTGRILRRCEESEAHPDATERETEWRRAA